MGNNEIFSRRLNQCLKRTGKDKHELSKIMGMSYSGVCHFFTGFRLPSVEKLVQLADILCVSIDYLLGRTNDPRVKTGSVSEEEILLSQLPDELLPAYQAAKEKNPENVQQIIETFEKIAEEYHSLSK